MKPFSFPLILIFLSFCSLSYPDTNQTNMQMKTYSVQFGISGLLNITNFEGSLISAKYQLDPWNALRFGISPYYQYSSTNGIYTGSSFNINLEGDYLYYLNPFSPIKVYLGIGLIQGFYYQYDPNALADGDNQYSLIWNSSLTVLLGFEWMFTPDFSLFLENGFVVKNGYEVDNNPYYSTPFIYDNISISPINIVLGLSIYL